MLSLNRSYLTGCIREWTEQEVRGTINSPYTTRTGKNKATGNAETVSNIKEAVDDKLVTRFQYGKPIHSPIEVLYENDTGYYKILGCNRTL